LSNQKQQLSFEKMQFSNQKAPFSIKQHHLFYDFPIKKHHFHWKQHHLSYHKPPFSIFPMARSCVAVSKNLNTQLSY